LPGVERGQLQSTCTVPIWVHPVADHDVPPSPRTAGMAGSSADGLPHRSDCVLPPAATSLSSQPPPAIPRELRSRLRRGLPCIPLTCENVLADVLPGRVSGAVGLSAANVLVGRTGCLAHGCTTPTRFPSLHTRVRPPHGFRGWPSVRGGHSTRRWMRHCGRTGRLCCKTTWTPLRTTWAGTFAVVRCGSRVFAGIRVSGRRDRQRQPRRGSKLQPTDNANDRDFHASATSHRDTRTCMPSAGARPPTSIPAGHRPPASTRNRRSPGTLRYFPAVLRPEAARVSEHAEGGR